MNKAKKIIFIIAFSLLAFAGILFIAIPFKGSFFVNNLFLFITLIIVGVFGLITCIFLFFLNPLNKSDFFSKNFESLFEKANKIKDTISSNLSLNENEVQQKVCCPYCKNKYNSSLDRCPNCGAPPNSQSK